MASAKVEIKVSGVDAFLGKLRAWQSSKKVEFAAIADTTADAIVADAKAIVPVRTAFLKNSIEKQKQGLFRVVVVANAPYATFVEFGTSRQRAQPFLTPAYEKNKDAFLSNIRASIRRI